MMSAKRGLQFLQVAAEGMLNNNSFDLVTKDLQITGGGDGKCVAEFIISKEHLNFGGTLHVGFIVTIVDLVTTYALMSHPSHPGVSVDMHVSNLKEAQEGDEIIVDAKTVRADKNLAYIECELKRKEDNVVIAKGGHSKYVDLK